MFLIIKDVIHIFTEPKCRRCFSQRLVNLSHVNLFAHFLQLYIWNCSWGGGVGSGRQRGGKGSWLRDFVGIHPDDGSGLRVLHAVDPLPPLAQKQPVPAPLSPRCTWHSGSGVSSPFTICMCHFRTLKSYLPWLLVWLFGNWHQCELFFLIYHCLENLPVFYM